MPSLTENVLKEAATLPLKELPAPKPSDLSDPAVREAWSEAYLLK
jgi:hypothetical protein